MIFSSDKNGAKPIDRTQPIQALYGSQNSSGRQTFTTGKDYEAEVISQSEDKSLNVRVAGTIFKIQVAADIASGQILTLRYLNSVPDPTFLLIKAGGPPTNQADKTVLSQAAQNIGQFLYEEKSGSIKSAPYEEAKALTDNPELPRMTAGNLRQLIDTSGLFYESHLADFLEGKRALSLMMQEPQNKTGFDPAILVVKQLEVLEQNKLHWTGEVWPQQNMDWTTLIQRRSQPNNTKDNSDKQSDQTGITSIMKFDFENLGTVKASLQMNQGHLQVKFETSNTNSSRILKSQTNMLALSLKNIAQKLEAISVSSL